MASPPPGMTHAKPIKMFSPERLMLKLEQFHPSLEGFLLLSPWSSLGAVLRDLALPSWEPTVTLSLEGLEEREPVGAPTWGRSLGLKTLITSQRQARLLHLAVSRGPREDLWLASVCL